jgi:mevalonate pyrophosphate decarboxylase
LRGGEKQEARGSRPSGSGEENKQGAKTMLERAKAIAFPTIPIIFVAGVREGTRIPAHNTMGMAVTDLSEKVRTETVALAGGGLGKNETRFFLAEKEVDLGQTPDLAKIIGIFREKSGFEEGLRIESNNYNIYSGSSDSGLAALVFALDALFETGLGQDELADIAMIGSESSIRAVYGGLNEIYVEDLEKPRGELLAAPEELSEIKIFALNFDKPGRYSAREIFETNQANPLWKTRMEFAPYWEREIKEALREKDWNRLLYNAEVNCMHAHFLFECSGKRMHNKEMTCARIDVDEIRLSGIPCYWTAGGGNVINVFSFGEHASKAKAELEKRGWKPIEYKVASGAKVTEKK